MKNLSIYICAVILMCFTGACKENVEMEKAVEFEIVSVHDIRLKPDVNVKEFETFVWTELAPIYNKMKGQKLTLVKGDRGIRNNEYAIILTFESIEDRNRIYPPSGGFVGDFGEDSLWEKFNSMIEVGLGQQHTDYVRVIH
ncbi:MAG: hypothetical protein R3250_06330 [Melioribacteraceae bacterium]|nr:hypothetical protein [Melioribacteraceae bacterium]